MTRSQDEHFMHHAIAVARTGLGRRANGRPFVGCVLVKDGHVIAAARTGDGGAPHAEAAALALAENNAEGSTAYVTLEPCAHQGKTPPCSQALIKAGIKRCVIGCRDPFDEVNGQGIRDLEAAGIDVSVGMVEAEANKLHQGFFLAVTEKRPLVTIKLAVSADGKIAGAPGRQTKITGDLAQRHTHLERSMHDAVLVGRGTVEADDPMLEENVRFPGYKHKITRMVLDGRLRISHDAKLVQSAADDPLCIFYHKADEGKISVLKSIDGVELVHCPNSINEASVLEALAERGITRLLIEGGAEVATSFLRTGYCDRFLLYRAPHEIGPQGVDALAGLEIGALETQFNLKRTENRALGEDLLEIYEKSA